MIAKRFVGISDYPVATVPSIAPMPSGLVVQPGVYTLSGVNYDCREQGLYRFWEPMADTQHRIVYRDNIDAFMSACAWLHVNGRSDEGLTLAERTNTAVKSKLRMLCGKTVEWVQYLCNSLGIQNRVVRCLTAGTPSGYYDGHVMLEAGPSWKLYDVANGFTYRSAAGSRLVDVVPLLPSTAATGIDGDAYAAEAWTSGFDVTAWQENTMRTPEQKRSELERIFQIPGVDHSDGLTYFYLPAGMESASSYVTGLSASYRVIPKATWLSMFYP